MQPQAGDATPITMTTPQAILTDMNDRTREVFRRVVEGYLTSGEPVGSRTLTRTLSEKVSAATVRNVMQDLEFLGLLDSPHVSAGRVPTQAGLRMFVDSLLEIGQVAPEDQEKIDATLGVNDHDVTTLLDEVGAALSVITRGASVVLSPKREAAIRHIEFVSLGADRALVVLVFADGQVENRVFVPPPGQTPSSMREAANFLNALAEGRTLSELRARMVAEIASRRQEIDSLARQLVESGLALWENAGEPSERLIVRGRANLIGEAANFLNALAEGRTLSELRARMVGEIASRRQEIDSLARQLVESGLALWENAGEPSERLIVRGRANLIGEAVDQAEIDRIRVLFDDLERKRDIAEFLNLTEAGEGVRIFIGSENKLFSLSGSSLVVSPYMNADRKIIGAVGVIGPTRLNYGRIVPIVDYTAQLVGRLVSDRGKG